MSQTEDYERIDYEVQSLRVSSRHKKTIAIYEVTLLYISGQQRENLSTISF